MASTSNSAGLPRLKPKKPLDVWSTREKLCLSSAVFKIGDQNWVSVSRAIKPYMEPNRPAEWFHQKNCVVQYYDMMEKLEQPKRKRGDRSETDTPSLQIMRKMTIERSEQLKKEILEMQQTFKQLKSEVEAIKAGLMDDCIKETWEKIQKEEEMSQLQQVKTEVKMEELDDDAKTSVTDSSDITSALGDLDDSTQDSIVDISVLTDEESTHTAGSGFMASTPVITSLSSSPSTSTTTTTIISTSTTTPTTVEVTSKSSTASHLLSSLLKSEVKTAIGLQQLKREHEQEQVQENQQVIPTPNILPHAQRALLKIPVTQDDPLTAPPSNSKGSTPVSNSSVSMLATPSEAKVSSSELPVEVTGTEELIEEAVIDDIQEALMADFPSVYESQEDVKQNTSGKEDDVFPVVESIEEEVIGEEIVVKEEEEEGADNTKVLTAELDVEGVDVKEEMEKDEDFEDLPLKRIADGLGNEAGLRESSIKEEPLSPTSSISSRISETGSKPGSRGRGRPRSTKAHKIILPKSNIDDGGSDVELSEDDGRESEDILSGHMASVNASSILSESFPNSPASLSMCSDTEEEKSFKQWKKSIMLVWRAAATHKYANVFLHPVTDEIAPGYRTVVLRPMDLSTIKKNIETGIIRTTVEFQHDMMLMFTNAIMYNSSDHNVFKMAKEMYDDVMQHIEMMIQTTDSKNLRQSRRPDTSDKEDDPKKRRLSIDQSEGGKTKKRKTRLDESLPI